MSRPLERKTKLLKPSASGSLKLNSDATYKWLHCPVFYKLAKETNVDDSPSSTFFTYCRFVIETYFDMLSKGQHCDPAELFLLYKELYVVDGRYNMKWFLKTGVVRFNTLLSLLKLENAVPISGRQDIIQELGSLTLSHRISALWLSGGSPRAVVFVPFSNDHQCEWSYSSHFIHDWLRSFYQKIGTVAGNPCRVLFIYANGNEFSKYSLHQVAVEENHLSGAEAMAVAIAKLTKEGKAASISCPSRDCIFKERCFVLKVKDAKASQQDATDA